MNKECRRCGLLNPESATACDCGYRFKPKRDGFCDCGARTTMNSKFCVSCGTPIVIPQLPPDIGPTLFIAALGNSEAAELLRAQLANRLGAAGFVISERFEDADLTLTGTAMVYLGGMTLSFALRLVGKDGTVVWADEANTVGIGIATARAADRITAGLTKLRNRGGRK